MKISIVTPNYNYSKYIARTIESVIAQDYINYEHIIVDDGSTDNSVEIIKSYQEKYPDKIKLVIQENKGQTPALNTGLKLATGDIVGWINSDDTYCKNILSLISDVFNGNSNLDVVYGDFNIIDVDDRIIKKVKNMSFNYFLFLMKGFGINMASNTVFWKRSLHETIGYFNERFIYNMDGEFFSRLTYKHNVSKLNLPVANWRSHYAAKTIVIKNNLNDKYKEEKEYEFYNSYKLLKISKIIPYKFAYLIKYPALAMRSILKFINGHYFFEYYSI